MQKVIYFFTAVFIFCLGIFFYFDSLGVGAPKTERSLSIFQTQERLAELAPRVIELREKYYDQVKDLLDPNKPEDSKRYQQVYKQTMAPLAVASQDQILNATRSFLMGVVNSDEQNTIAALGRLNPAKLQFNPGVNTFYGGMYYYTCGAALLASKLLGFLVVSSDPLFYVLNPEYTRVIYVVVRSVGGISALLTLMLLFFWVSQRQNVFFALLASAIFVTVPSVVVYAHFAKAHLYGMFLFFAGFYLFWKTVKNPSWTNYVLGSVVLGSCAGSIITNLTCGVAIFFIEASRNNWNVKAVFSNVKFYVACAIFFVMYASTNYYILLNWAEFQKTLWLLREYMQGYGESYGQINSNLWLPFLKDSWTVAMHPYLLLLTLIGSWRAFKTKNQLYIVSFYICAFLTVLNLLTTRHLGLHFRILPLMCLLAVWGAEYLWSARARWIQMVFAVWFIFGVSLSAAHCWFELKTWRTNDDGVLIAQQVSKQVPLGSSIGLNVPNLSVMSAAPIRFLDYKIVHYPENLDQEFTVEELPDYVLLSRHNSPVLKKYYQPVAVWKSRVYNFFGFYTLSPYLPTWQLFKKIEAQNG